MSPHASFFYVYGTALVLVELVLGLAFALRALAESSRRMAYLATAYAWSAPLAVLNIAALPGIAPGFAPLPLQVAPSSWVLWHIGWPLALLAYAFMRESPGRLSRYLVPVALVAALGACYAVSSAGDRLPPLVGPDGTLLPLYRALIALAFVLDLIAFARLVRTAPNLRDIWVLLAIVCAGLEAVLMFSTHVRFNALFYFARVVGLCSAFAMLGALVSDAYDVVRRAALQRADRERLAEIRALADAMPQIVWQVSSEGRNLYANARWSEYTGRRRVDGRDEDYLAAIHPEDRTARNASFTAALASGGTYEATYRLRGADGSYRYFLTRAVPMIRAGSVVGWTGTSTDIDDRRRLELRQRGAYEREARDAGRMRILASIGHALSQSLDIDNVTATAVAGLVPQSADWALLNLLDSTGKLVVAATHHRDPQIAQRLRRLVGRSYLRSNATGGSVDAASSGRGILSERIDGALLARTIAPDWLEFFESLRAGSSIVVPLYVGGNVRGTLNLVYAESERRYVADDLEMLEEVGRRVALAIENAELYAREHRVAERLQRASLPASLPTFAGVELDAIYQAGRSEALIGGDWYDAFALDDGRLIVGVGDVMGSGLEAAVTMNAVRQSIRGAAEVFPDPVTILNAADRALAKTQPDRIVTAFLGILEPASGALTYASAGHPAPFVRGPDGRVTKLEGHGLPLGLRRDFADPRETSLSAVVDEGALLVLYTDGLTEVERDIEKGEARLTRILAADIPAAFPAEHIRGSVLGAGEPLESRDDIAILTIRLTAARVPAARDFACDARDGAALATMRRAVVDALAEWGLSGAALFNAELVLGELLANVARYAPGTAEVRLDLAGSAPVVTVLDRGPGMRCGPELPDWRQQRGRGLYIAAELVRELRIGERVGGGAEVRVTLATETPSVSSSAEHPGSVHASPIEPR